MLENIGIFDSHAHYEDKKFDEDREELLASMSSSGVKKIVNVGSDLLTSVKSVELANRYDFVYAAVGFHPEECGGMTENDLVAIRNLAAKEKVVAIGEIGLDYYWPEPEHKIQKIWFEKQLFMAGELGMPVIIHSRDAAKDTMDIIKKHYENLPERRGVIHCYSGSAEMAQEYVNMGFFIGVGGVVTFKNSNKLKGVVEKIDISNILIETDCPYMAPVPNRGKRNDSSMLIYVADMIAQIKGMTKEDVIRITHENALRMYGLS